MNIQKICSMVITAILIVICTGCEAKPTERAFFAMDTYIQLSVYGNGADKAESEIKRLDKLFSKSDNSSDINRINAASGNFVDVHDDTINLIRRGIEISVATEYMFDIEIYPLTKLWNFKSNSPSLPDKNQIDSAIRKSEECSTIIKGNSISSVLGIDIGGIGKGYVAMKTRETLKSCGVNSAAVSLGGNVMLIGRKPDGSKWNVGIAHPVKSGEIIGQFYAENTSVVTSGGYQRYFEFEGKRYHHILNNKTGYPADNGIISATIISNDDTFADAMSTAAYVMGVDNARAFWEKENSKFDMILITDDCIYITENIKDDFIIVDEKYRLEIMTYKNE